jgi:hypothetical protein
LSKNEKGENRFSFLKRLKILLSSWEYVIFLLAVLLLGLSLGVVNTIFFLFLKDLGGNATLMGASLTGYLFYFF